MHETFVPCHLGVSCDLPKPWQRLAVLYYFSKSGLPFLWAACWQGICCSQSQLQHIIHIFTDTQPTHKQHQVTPVLLGEDVLCWTVLTEGALERKTASRQHQWQRIVIVVKTWTTDFVIGRLRPWANHRSRQHLKWWSSPSITWLVTWLITWLLGCALEQQYRSRLAGRQSVTYQYQYLYKLNKSLQKII